MKTLREQYIEALIKLGEIIIDEKAKSIKLSRKEGGYYYLGKSGSLRYGTTKSTSVVCILSFKQKLLQTVN